MQHLVDRPSRLMEVRRVKAEIHLTNDMFRDPPVDVIVYGCSAKKEDKAQRDGGGSQTQQKPRRLQNITGRDS